MVISNIFGISPQKLWEETTNWRTYFFRWLGSTTKQFVFFFFSFGMSVWVTDHRWWLQFFEKWLYNLIMWVFCNMLIQCVYVYIYICSFIHTHIYYIYIHDVIWTYTWFQTFFCTFGFFLSTASFCWIVNCWMIGHRWSPHRFWHISTNLSEICQSHHRSTQTKGPRPILPKNRIPAENICRNGSGEGTWLRNVMAITRVGEKSECGKIVQKYHPWN